MPKRSVTGGCGYAWHNDCRKSCLAWTLSDIMYSKIIKAGEKRSEFLRQSVNMSLSSSYCHEPPHIFFRHDLLALFLFRFPSSSRGKIPYHTTSTLVYYPEVGLLIILFEISKRERQIETWRMTMNRERCKDVAAVWCYCLFPVCVYIYILIKRTWYTTST